MKQALIILMLFFTVANLCGQTSYTGFIDQYPIELVADIDPAGGATAIYAYSKFDEPIVLDGKLERAKLTFFEKDNEGKNKATIVLENFNAASLSLEGFWKDLKTGKQLRVKLRKMFALDTDEIEWQNREILQPVSLPDKYFKLVVSKAKGDLEAKVIGIKVIEKKTDRLIQKIDIDCQLLGLNNVSVGDYNFDGTLDFSVFEQSYAGPNTSSLYFIYNNTTGKFFNSGFEGVSLSFDNTRKIINEHNQCCAGRGHTNATYKVVDNKMVLIKKTCMEYNEKKKDFVEVKCE